jgi:hypothetical protein
MGRRRTVLLLLSRILHAFGLWTDPFHHKRLTFWTPLRLPQNTSFFLTGLKLHTSLTINFLTIILANHYLYICKCSLISMCAKYTIIRALMYWWKKGVLFVKSNKYIIYCCLCAAIAIGGSSCWVPSWTITGWYRCIKSARQERTFKINAKDDLFSSLKKIFFQSVAKGHIQYYFL